MENPIEKYEAECIHLRACRRMALIEKKQLHMKCVRHCNRDTCSAFQTLEDFGVQISGIDVYVGCSEFQYATLNSSGELWLGDTCYGTIDTSVYVKEDN